MDWLKKDVNPFKEGRIELILIHPLNFNLYYLFDKDFAVGE